jgi:methionyl-tRNA formyltransferase
MKVLVLSPNPERIRGVFKASGDEIVVTAERIHVPPVVDLVVCYNYNHIIKEPFLSRYDRGIINIHIAMLPWNRGTDPNFWSWFDRTPKGASIHYIDAGIDTGDLLTQAAIEFGPDETLATSHAKLLAHADCLFSQSWALIRSGTAVATRQGPGGSLHREKDKEPYWKQMPLRYETPVSVVEVMGVSAAATERSKEQRGTAETSGQRSRGKQ